MNITHQLCALAGWAWQRRWYVLAPLIIYLLIIQYIMADMGGQTAEFIYENF